MQSIMANNEVMRLQPHDIYSAKVEFDKRCQDVSYYNEVGSDRYITVDMASKNAVVYDKQNYKLIEGFVESRSRDVLNIKVTFSFYAKVQ